MIDKEVLQKQINELETNPIVHYIGISRFRDEYSYCLVRAHKDGTGLAFLLTRTINNEIVFNEHVAALSKIFEAKIIGEI